MSDPSTAELVERVRVFFECPYADAVDPGLHSGCRWCAEAEPAREALTALQSRCEELERVQRGTALESDERGDRANELSTRVEELERELHKERLLHPRSDGEWAKLMNLAECAEAKVLRLREALNLALMHLEDERAIAAVRRALSEEPR